MTVLLKKTRANHVVKTKIFMISPRML